MKTKGMAVVLGALVPVSPVAAQSTTTYTYDALGRLTGSTVSGGPTNGTTTAISLDNAGNRTNYKVTGASGSGNGSGNNGDGAAAPQSRRVIVVPLNGFTIIPIS